MKKLKFKGEWGVCSNPIIFGEVLIKHVNYIGIGISTDSNARNIEHCPPSDVVVFSDRKKAEDHYFELLDTQDRVKKTGI
jgi:hypothetical protein